MYLIGGPPFSGTTLLALLLNQGDFVCLDEPDLHDPAQSHRGIPLLQSLFPDAVFPARPDGPLSHADAVTLMEECERAIAPRNLGMKTCEATFVRYARVYNQRGYPVIAMVRDIRDALASDLPDWQSEAILNAGFRTVWENLHLCDLWVRYEDLVTDTAAVMERISGVLACRLLPIESWDASRVHSHMLKLDRHEPLMEGRIVRDRVGVWRDSGKRYSADTQETASMMGY